MEKSHFVFPEGIILSQLNSKYSGISAAGLRGLEAADSGNHEPQKLT